MQWRGLLLEKEHLGMHFPTVSLEDTERPIQKSSKMASLQYKLAAELGSSICLVHSLYSNEICCPEGVMESHTMVPEDCRGQTVCGRLEALQGAPERSLC